MEVLDSPPSRQRPFELVTKVLVHFAREYEDEGHNMGRDVVVEDTPEIRYNDIASDQFVEIVTLGRTCGGSGQPLQAGARREQLRIEGAETGVGPG